MRIESAFIADHVEVDPTTGMLDVQSGFQNCAKVPNLPFRHVMGLAIVVQVAFDEYDHPFRLTIDVERVDGLPVMHHEDFTFEIPHGIGAMDGISHHFPFAFSLPVEFYEVGVHRIIVGDDDSDSAVIPFVVEMVTLEHDRVRSSGCATFAQPMSPPGDQRIRNRRSSGPYAQGDAHLPEDRPGFVHHHDDPVPVLGLDRVLEPHCRARHQDSQGR